MFRLQFFGALPRQRRELLAATEFEPIRLHPAVQRQLDLVRAGARGAGARGVRSTYGLCMYVLRGLRELILENVVWNALNALIVLGAVLIAREVFQAKASLAVGLGLTGAYFVLKILQALIEYGNACRRLQVHRGIQISLYQVINDKLMHISPAGRAKFSKGQLKTIVGSDVESIEDFLSASLQQWIPLIVSIAVIVPALWLVSGAVGLVALCSVLLLVPIAVIGAFFVERFQTMAQAEQDALTTIIGEWVKNIRLVRFLGWGERMEQDINQKMGSYILLAALRHATVIVVWGFSFSWHMVPLLAIFWFSYLQPTPLNLVEVFSSFWLVDFLLSQIQYIPHSISMFGAAVTGAHRVVELLRQPELEDSLLPHSEPTPAASARPERICFRHVTAAFGSCQAIRDLSISFSLSERTAIVGSVGSGKTTLLELLIGELPIAQGVIEVEYSDGTVAPLWRRDVYAHLRSIIAYSPQQPFLSNNSLRLNIDLSGQSPDRDVEDALAAAQLSDDIALFPRGLAEEVGESGINLSGGQKQRVSIARAFLSRRSLLVLDDPLSAVDGDTERALMNEILGRAKGLILVSHRLAELERCDRVIVLQAGEIVEDGSPKQLAKDANSQFRRFLDALEAHEH